jgi:biopolymer transport protein ExbB
MKIQRLNQFIRKAKHLHLAGLIALGLLCLTPLVQAEPNPAAASDDSAPAIVHKKTLWEQLQEGGWVMFPIGACSIFTVYLIGDGIIRTGLNKISPAAHEATIKALFRQGDYVGAYNYCKANPSPLTNVLRVGISLLGDGKVAVDEGLMGEITKENGRLQTWISYLSVIGVCTPMIGLLGTVTGMIKAFATLGSSGIGDPSSLAAAIGEVLVATASGLFIAIPAFGSFYFLRNRAAGAIHHVQDTLNGLFRKMPYDAFAGVHIGDDELYASAPNWLENQAPAETFQ